MVNIGAPIFAHEQTMDNYRYIPIEHAYLIDETGAYLVELAREEDGRWSATLPGFHEFTIRGFSRGDRLGVINGTSIDGQQI